MDTSTNTTGRVTPWNKGKLLGQKPPLKLKEIEGEGKAQFLLRKQGHFQDGGRARFLQCATKVTPQMAFRSRLNVFTRVVRNLVGPHELRHPLEACFACAHRQPKGAPVLPPRYPGR